ncbi:hypothetical protein ACSVH2_13500 [Flavobacterium sp. RSB2_4_14]|uniref:hypothetical protein n=1 Tax=Flavobacterium sp. RSB2_4_14 TaxID=3447665 RepID=UPI003F2B7B1D
MKKISTLVILLISILSYSQKSFVKGYYIDQANNKKEGFIEDTNPYNNPEKIYFKTSLEDKYSEISIDNIIEFKVNENYKYVKYTVDYDYDQVVNSNEIKIFGKEPNLKQKVVLLKVLVEGNVSLYKAIIDDEIFFYVKNSNDVNPKLLVHRKYNNDKSIVENNDFRKMLYDELKSDKLLFNDFLDIDYKENELSAIFIKANTENNSLVEQNVATEKWKNKLYFKILAGVSSYKSPYVYKNVYELTPTNVSFNDPMIGVEFSNVFGVNSKRSELFARLFYQMVKTQSNYFAVGNGGFNVEYFFKSDFSSINLTTGYRYAIIKKGKNKLCIDGSVGISEVINGDFKIDYLVTYTGPDPIPSPAETYVFDVVSTILYYNIGVGYVFNDKFGLNLEYSSNKNYLNKYSNLSGSFSNFNLIFSYTLNN